MTIQEFLNKIDKIITDTEVVSNWGGLSIHMTDKERPYGISKKESCSGSIYGQNDLVTSEGYMYIDKAASGSFEINRITKAFDFIVNIELFLTPEKFGEEYSPISKSLQLANLLWKHKINVTIKTSDEKEREHSTLSLKHRVYIGCNEQIYIDNECFC
jgi:hypothetical protein